MIVPQEIRNRRFKTGLRGYSPDEIEEFQERLALEFEELYSSNEKLKQRLGQVRSQIAALKETELGLERIQAITNHQGTLAEASALQEARELLDAALPHVEQRIRGYREVLQRIELLTEEAHMLWRIESVQSFPAELDEEMDLLSRQVQELSGNLEEYSGYLKAHHPINKMPVLTVEMLMAAADGELDLSALSLPPEEPAPSSQDESMREDFPVLPIDNEIGIVPTIEEPKLELKEALLANAIKIVEGRPRNGIDFSVREKPFDIPAPKQFVDKDRSHSKPEKKKAAGDSSRNRLAWALIFIVVVVSGISGGYFFSNYFDKLPPVFSNTEPSGGDSEALSASPLLAAVIANDIDQVKVLLNSGESTKTMTPQGESPLMIAAHKGNVELAEVLLRAGADPDLQTTDWGGTALMYGAFQGHLEIVELLAKNHADLDIKNKNGWTALMAAAYAGRPQTARFLVMEGADPYLESSDGLNAYQLAILAGRELTAQNMKQAGVLASEVGSGQLEPDQEGDFGKNPLLLEMFSLSVDS
ncbi:MAG: DivIVA domain-containing protein [Syntrophomonadaceae bacterium]|nr:DivIVA domain-containing protein [Syntrophomonadaceae bacterium]